jgi:hypothetical protein
MSEYARAMKSKIERWESEWDMSQPVNRREIRRLKRRSWWHSGPSTVFAACVGCAVGNGVGIGLSRMLGFI